MKKNILLLPPVCTVGVFAIHLLMKWVSTFEISPQAFFACLLAGYVIVLLGIIFYTLLVKALEDWRYLVGISLLVALPIDYWFGTIPSIVSCLVFSGVLAFLYK